MAKLTRAQSAERDEAIAKLREWLKPGDTVYTILDHVSSSGMSRAIRVVLPSITGPSVESVAPGGKVTDYVRRDGITVDFLHPNWAVGKALGLRHWKRHGREQDALVVGGCGMDMGFHLVYELSQRLFGEGYQCLGKGKCPSNYHVNHRDIVRCEGTRVYNPDGPDTGAYCRRPDYYSTRYPEVVPKDQWPRAAPIDVGDGQTIPGPFLACIEVDGQPLQVCPTCKGEGGLPNPEGPERFDLVHTDGYALRHRWL